MIIPLFDYVYACWTNKCSTMTMLPGPSLEPIAIGLPCRLFLQQWKKIDFFPWLRIKLRERPGFEAIARIHFVAFKFL